MLACTKQGSGKGYEEPSNALHPKDRALFPQAHVNMSVSHQYRTGLRGVRLIKRGSFNNSLVVSCLSDIALGIGSRIREHVNEVRSLARIGKVSDLQGHNITHGYCSEV